MVGEGVGSGNFDIKRERDFLFFLLGWDAGKGKVAGYSTGRKNGFTERQR